MNEPKLSDEVNIKVAYGYIIPILLAIGNLTFFFSIYTNKGLMTAIAALFLLSIVAVGCVVAAFGFYGLLCGLVYLVRKAYWRLKHEPKS